MKLLALGVLLGFLIALGGDVFAHRDDEPAQDRCARNARPKPRSPLSAAEAAQLAEVLDRVQREYVDTVSHPELVDDALRGLVGGLDPYSSYLDAEEYADLRVSTAGTYAGIGIEVSTADRALRVVRPFRDSPAAAAGIRSGDMISAIDGTPVGADLDAAMARMRGPRGSTVKLAVMRTGQSLPLEFTVERAQVDVHSVAMVKLDDAYLYARITSFSDTTAEDFAASIARLRRDMHVEAARRRARPAQQSRRRARVRGGSGRPAARDAASSSPPMAARPPRASPWKRRPAKCCPACRWSSW